MKNNHHKPSLLYFLLMILVIGLTDFTYYTLNSQYYRACTGLFTCYSCFLLPVYFLRNHLKQYAGLLLVVFLFIPLSLGGILFFNLPLTDGLALAIANTTKTEAVELLHNYILIFLVSIFLLVLLFRFLLKRTAPALPRKLALTISLASLGYLLIFPVLDIQKKVSAPYTQKIRGNIYTTFPFSIGYCTSVVYRQFALINKTKKERDAFRFGASQPVLKNNKQIYVLIIGESARYDHWGLNGYPRETSPRLSTRSNLISFSHTVAGAGFTEFAVPQIITLANADHFESHYTQRSILEAYREAGFKTYWITDQFDMGHIRMHQSDADVLKQQRLEPGKNIQVNNSDFGLFRFLQEAMTDTASKKFILIHTMGSHFDYGSRYLDNYDRFKPSLKTAFANPNDYTKKSILINSYDNTILFADAFIDSVIHLVEVKKIISSVFYISDHGENLFDDGQRRSLHAEVVPSIYTAQVPLFIWYSDSLKRVFPEKVDYLIQHKDYKTAAEDLFPTLTDLSDIHFARQDSTRCIDGKYFKASSQRLIGSGMQIINFDSIPIN